MMFHKFTYMSRLFGDVKLCAVNIVTILLL